jgi:phospholipase C
LKRVVFILLAVAAIAALTVPLLASAGHPSRRHVSPRQEARIAVRHGIHKIRHVVVIMQENRSFDSYFGTFPGADGIPGMAGNPGPLPCVPDPDRKTCETPFHDVTDRDAGGPHGHGTALADIAGGRMDGFINQAEVGRTSYCKKHFDDPRCSFMPGKPDVMGYHDWREIPNYWEYASQFALQDHMFESDSSWSLPEHLYLVSGWSAKCTTKGDPMSCHSEVQNPESPPGEPGNTTGEPPDYAWTDLTYLLYRRARRRRASGIRSRGSTRSSRTISCATSSRCKVSSRTSPTTGFPRSRGSFPPTRSATIRPPSSRAVRHT